MEYKDLPFRKRKLDKSILEKLGILPGGKQQKVQVGEASILPGGKQKKVQAGEASILPGGKQQKVQAGDASIQPDVTSLVLNAAGERDRCLTIKRRVSGFNRNLDTESAQRSRMKSADNCYILETAPVKTLQGSHDTDGACEGMTKSLKASSKCMPSDKAAPVASESIWEGSMQFDFNTKVPMLAFFKSGQKLLDISWSSLVEIKGKLPLEDFENYIRDLPRSRTRKLMVISLCWKLSTSTAALEFLRSVVTRYETTKQVAYAQPSPDVRLYMYPWNEVITTTLVKCGYLEEKAAIADESELLIGCVVWKGNQITSGSLLNLSEGIGSYSLKEQDCKTGKKQTTTDTLSKLSDNKDFEPLKEQGSKSPIRKDQNNSGSLLEQSKNRGVRLVKEPGARLLELRENKGVEPSKEQGFKSAIRKSQKNAGSLLEQSKNTEAGPLKKREIRGAGPLKKREIRGAGPLKKREIREARPSKEQEVWSLVRSDQTSSCSALKYSTRDCTDPQKEQGLKFRNEHLLHGQSNLPSKRSKWQQSQTAPTFASELSRTNSFIPLCKVEKTVVGKSILKRPKNKNPSVGNDNDLPGLISSMHEPSAVEKIKPSLSLNSNSFKTTSRNLSADSPGHLRPSEFPINLESSNNPKPFRGSPLPKQIRPPIPNQNNSLSRYFTFSQNPRRP